MSTPIAILKTGTTHPKLKAIFGDFEDWFSGNNPCADFTTFDLPKGAHLPPVESFAGYIITGSPAMVTDNAPWSEALKPFLREIISEQTPLLAVCYGHQLLAASLDGAAGWHPKGREIGSVAIRLTPEGEQDPLLGMLPNPFMAHVTHAQSVLKLPSNATLLAFNEYEPHHAYRIGHNAWSVQFHPEFHADIMRGYLFETAAKLLDDNRDVSALLQQIKQAHANQDLIDRFVQIAKGEC